MRQNDDIRNVHISRNIDFTQALIRPSGTGEDELQ